MFELHNIILEDTEGAHITYHEDYCKERNLEYARKAYECWHNNPGVKGYRYMIVDGVRYAIHSK